MARPIQMSALLAVAVLTTACGGDLPSGASPSAGLTVSPSNSSTKDVDGAAAECPSSQGGVCRGELSAGTYQTRSFEPRLSYTVPEGWSNMEDLPGNFLLLPPGRSNAGVDAGTADYLGVYSAVTVGASDCRPEPMPGVGMNPSAIVEALRSRTGLKTTTPRKVAVGGLSGLVIDIQMAPGTKTRCSAPNIGGIIPLIIGVGPAELEHAQFPKLRTRLYLLADGDSNVVVEVSDVPTDAPFTDYESVVQEFRFSPES